MANSGIKFKSPSLTNQIVMRILPILAFVAAVIVFFFAVIFALAAPSVPGLTQSRLLTSVILFIIGLAIIVGIYAITRKPKTVIQHLEL